MLVTDQAQHRVLIVIAPSGHIIREWKAADIPEAHRKWFRNPSEVKFSRDARYILTCASGGGAAIIRYSDAKTVWYDSVGGNPHSIDIAPHNTAVVASSTGNMYTIFRYDTASSPYRHGRPRKTVFAPDAHAVNFFEGNFYIAGSNHIWICGFREGEPNGVAKVDAYKTVKIPGRGAHDMIYGTRDGVFYLTMVDTLLEFHTKDNSFHPIAGKIQRNIKSFSESPDKVLPNTVTVPQEQWWTDEVQDQQGNILLKIPGAKIYKARWLRTFVTTETRLNAKGDTVVFKKW